MARSSVRSALRWLLRLGQLLLIGLVVYFWGRALWANWAGLQRYRWEVHPAPLAASLVVLVAHLALLALIWWWSLRFFGQPAGLRAGLSVWLMAQIARYLPGGMWDTVGRIYLGGQAGLSRTRTGLSVVVEMVTQSVAAALVFLVSLLFWPELSLQSSLAGLQSQIGRGAWLVMGLIVLALGVLYPPVLGRVLNVAMRLIGRPAVELPLRYRDVLALTACHFGARSIVGGGFYLFVSAFYPLPVSLLPVAAGIFAIAWLIGFVIVFVPLGLGVREGIITALLAAFVPLPVATVAALGFRVWISLRDLLGAGAGLALRRTAQTERVAVRAAK
jgi:glycosyltransferase 2 family protein